MPARHFDDLTVCASDERDDSVPYMLFEQMAIFQPNCIELYNATIQTDVAVKTDARGTSKKYH